jgi:hypothetical protein
MNGKKELTAKVAARRLGITLDAVYRLLAVGKLQGRKNTDDEWLIPADAVEIRRKARMKLRRAYQQRETGVAVGA